MVLFVLAGCALANAFPNENDVRKMLQPGLTPDEVVALLGEPSTGRVVPCVDCTFKYIAPAGHLTIEREGYIGVQIRFKEGRVDNWDFYTSNPSYAEPKMPRHLRDFLWFFGIMFALGIIQRYVIRTTPVAAVLSNDLARAFENREFHLDKLPAEFRFITAQTTLQEITDKVGAPSRIVKIPIDPKRGLGYALISSGTSDAKILTFEYDLPYHAAVIVMPEFPFEPQSRTRAVFYRPMQRELAEASE